MIEIKGKHNEAKIFTDNVDEISLKQIEKLCDQEFVAESRIRLMPDVHAGAGCTIGTTMTITDKIVPNLVGVDIGCGMETIRLAERELDLERLDRVIRERIPYGFAARKKPHERCDEIELKDLCCLKFVRIGKAEKSIGTLGGGNHFIEINTDDEGNMYLVVHSGSRHLGLEVAHYYQDLADKALNGNDYKTIQDVIDRLKAEGRAAEIQQTLKEIKARCVSDVPAYLAYLTGELFEAYIHDMKIVQRYAVLNRRVMVEEILKGMDLHVEEQFTTIHNYIDTETMILRKGAVSAKEGEKLLIPINMRDGSLICFGKGNEDWNYSAPHGAGRLVSRTQARKTFTVDEFEKEMANVFSTTIGKDTLDECPKAYKDMSNILDNIGPTADVLKIIRPVYNFKAGE